MTTSLATALPRVEDQTSSIASSRSRAAAPARS